MKVLKITSLLSFLLFLMVNIKLPGVLSQEEYLGGSVYIYGQGPLKVRTFKEPFYADGKVNGYAELEKKKIYIPILKIREITYLAEDKAIVTTQDGMNYNLTNFYPSGCYVEYEYWDDANGKWSWGKAYLCNDAKGCISRITFGEKTRSFKKCPQEGIYFPEYFNFCPYCGAKLMKVK